MILKALKYSCKQVHRLIFPAAIAAVFLGFFSKLFDPIAFLAKYRTMPIARFSDMIKASYSFSWLNVLSFIGGMLLIALALSWMMAMIEFHFKTGRHDFKQSLLLARRYLWITLLYLFLFIVFILLFAFLAPAVAFLAHYLFMGAGAHVPSTVCYLIVLAIFSAFYFFSFLTGGYFSIALCHSVQSGYGFWAALSAASQSLEGKNISLALGFTLPSIAVVPVIVCLHNKAFLPYINIALFAVMLIYYAVLIQTAFFKLNEIERKDKKEVSFFK